MSVFAVSPRVPTHCTVMVVVGSRCQVRKRVLGSKGASSGLVAMVVRGLSAPRIRPEASPARDAPRNARREKDNMAADSGWKHGGEALILSRSFRIDK